MKVMTILGTRPEIIRLSRVIPLLDAHSDHVLIHTGQNYTDTLSGLFFRELGVRDPDRFLGVQAPSFGEQIGQILTHTEALLREHRPDRVLILGDTNSGLAAIVARRLGIPVYHMEAGNRCYDDRVPEEVNRRIIDHSSSVLLPYTNRSRENLLREGIAGERIFVTGNPIMQVIDHYATEIAASHALRDLGVTSGHYILVTMHRAESVDDPARLRRLVEALSRLQERHGHPVVVSTHPRTRARIDEFGVDADRTGLRWLEPLGFFDFVRLEQEAFCVLTDSGTVQEETCLFGVPNVTIRDVTERPETIDAGSNVLAGSDPAAIAAAVDLVTTLDRTWAPPPEYLVEHVAEAVVRIVLGYRPPDPAEIAWTTGG
ncbi:MAG TPA: UDP-N-acetylglucosamine 2-epimerase (non-hydrolyzing) [Actinobacteria bacterium]|nr:UDP-N-acetylglucosamine 2-epimerase (non-hydrolyzing) [Actinomycetota bacterium]